MKPSTASEAPAATKMRNAATKRWETIIVTAIGVRMRLRLKQREGEKHGEGMSVVVDMKGELYSLMVDSVGEVLSLPSAKFERNPPTLDPLWREFSNGIYRLEDKLLVVLDVPRLLDFTRAEVN